MIKSITVNDLFTVQDLLDKLYEQHIEFDINTAIKLSKIKKDVDESCKYIIERIYTAIPNMRELNHQLNENECIIYNAILNSLVDIENYGLSIDNLSKYDKVYLDLRLSEFLSLLF